jgi:hypothetical protein
MLRFVSCALLASGSLAAPGGTKGGVLQQDTDAEGHLKLMHRHDRNQRAMELIAKQMEKTHPELVKKLNLHAKCTHSEAVCAEQHGDMDWDAVYLQTRAVAHSMGFVQYLLNNCKSGFLAMATRDCSPANNLTGGQGMVVIDDAGMGGVFGAPVKVDAGFCGTDVPLPTGPVPWDRIRADGVRAPIFNGCTSDPATAYSETGPCGQFPRRAYVLAAWDVQAQPPFDPRGGGIGLTSETASTVLNVSTGGASIGLIPEVAFPDSRLHRAALQTAFECLGGWYGCEMFMCQHCPGCCNSDFPGGFEWQMTPSSFDGTVVWEEMYSSTPRHYVNGSDLLQGYPPEYAPPPGV